MKKIIIVIALTLVAVIYTKADWGVFDGIITTTAVTNITETTAKSGGTIKLLDDDASVTDKGIVWSTSANPTTTSNTGMTTQGAGPTTGNTLTFVSEMTGLQKGTKYYVRAYLENNDGIFYGQQRIFTTIPTLGEWGLIALGILFAGFGGWWIFKRFIA